MREILLHKVVISLGGKQRPLIRGMNRMACKLVPVGDSQMSEGTGCLILAKLCIAVGKSLKYTISRDTDLNLMVEGNNREGFCFQNIFEVW